METRELVAQDKTTWQNRLLPLMTWMLVGLTLFFFIASFVQLFYLHNRIDDAPVSELPPFVAEESEKAGASFQAMQWHTLAVLENYTLNQRYHQANVLLMARIWTRYLSFVTGMILCLVGASFILGKLKEDVTELGGTSGAGELSLKSSSPGIVLAVLGTVLMLTSVLSHNNITVTDGPAYLQLSTPTSSSASPAPTPLIDDATVVVDSSFDDAAIRQLLDQ